MSASLSALTDGGPVVIARVDQARGFGRRLLGLMGRRTLGPDRALWLFPCRAVHTCFMRFPLDLIFLDRRGCITRMLWDIPPWRVADGGPGSHSVLELESGWFDRTALQAGERLTILPSGQGSSADRRFTR
jgi:uncharacterized protein